MRHSFSPWASPLFAVPKTQKPNKPLEYSTVADFRTLNAVTVPDRYPLHLAWFVEAATKLHPFMQPTVPKVAHTLFRSFWLLPVIIFALFHFYFPPMFLFSILFHLFELSIYLVLSSLMDPILYNYGIYYKLCCPLGDFVSHDPSLATYFYMEVLLILYPLITIFSY